MKKRLTQGVNLTFWCLLANFFVWAPILAFGYVWDDHPTVENNASLRLWSTLWRGFFYDFWELHDDPQLSGYWRPMVSATYVLFGKILGFKPYVFHALNLSVHLGNVYLAMKLFSRIGLKSGGLLLAGLFFSVHPLHAETVSFISALPDLLSAFGGLLMLYYLSDPSSTIQKNSLALLAFFFCLLCKESGLIFLGFAAALLWHLKDDRLYTKVIAGLCVAIVYLLLHELVAPFSEVILAKESTENVVWTGIKVLGLSLSALFFPASTTPLRELSSLTTVSYLLSGLFLLLLAFFLFRRRQMPQKMFLFLLFFVPSALPALASIFMEGHVADRHFYLMAFSVALLLGSLPCPMGFVFVFGALWSGWTVHEARKWSSDDRLWTKLVQVSPRSRVAWNQLGNVRLAAGNYSEAELSFQRALEVEPSYGEAMLNLIVVDIKRHQFSQAMEKGLAYVEKFPLDPKGWDLLATAQVALLDLQSALTSQRKAVDLRPNHGMYVRHLELLYEMLAKSYEQDAHWKRAKEMYEQILATNPKSDSAMLGLRKMEQILSIQEEK